MKLSIIIPTYNEEAYLPKLLESIKRQDYNDYEVIVADADSTDKTVNIASNYGCRIVKGGMPAVGRNNGAKIAKGDLLLFLDSDLRLSKGYLKNCVSEFEEDDLGIAISQMMADSDKKYYQILHDFANKFMISVENIKPHGAGCYGIISKKSLHEEVGGFDESLNFGEDTDYIERIGNISEFKVLRTAKLYVSTRRLEEEGLISLVKVYGKSTINDFMGKRTSADELGYTFGHDLNKTSSMKNSSKGINSTSSHVKYSPSKLKFTSSNKTKNYAHSKKLNKNKIKTPSGSNMSNLKTDNLDTTSKFKKVETKKINPKSIKTKKPIKISTKKVHYKENGIEVKSNNTEHNASENVINSNMSLDEIFGNKNNINNSNKQIKLNKNSNKQNQGRSIKNQKSSKGLTENQNKKAKNSNIVKRSNKVIFYCVCGEGMGHAIRSAVILNHLVKEYNVFIFSGNRAYTYLNSKFNNVYEIGVFNTFYKNNVVNDVETFKQCMKENPSNIKKCYNTIFKLAKKYKPGLIISDFENYSNLVAQFLNIPLISLDNIHMISETEIDYPPNHKIDLLKAKAVIKVYVQNAKIHILTSFFNPPIKKGSNSVIYPPILRDHIRALKSVKGDKILVYQTSDSNYKLMENLKKIDEEFIVYGFNKNGTDKNLTFREFNEDIFYDDLRTAKAVITNGGFTLISESIYLKKPIYSMPALGNFEQILNGFYVDKLGYGEYHEDMEIDSIKNFLLNLDKYQKNLDKVQNSDNTAIFNELEKDIEKYYNG
ncbi:teichoic acid biosynthesis protein [Methanobrevibacter sp. 87.7]|uniref:MJ1255/VC2487 family glycosyltransferase n=1 Tax=Methanobrevibacter sp. 87.7 TaxID=387957 RepID=UPI000B724ECE|nr:MJ1255/VC2487 family glycosyltransferase [Methanobrevibacter sp. 87.7]OWT33331.1 teichoic acid biosynthesis protein [Methanobrevibacter sp. 87.7]